MLMPIPESDLSLNVLCLGANIINIIKKNSGKILTEDLLNKFLFEDSRRRNSQFFDTLNFLYILEIIDERGYIIYLKNGSVT